eukprot:CAMPEP_0113626054 /NCGR_PEP_ID=MMETSP0017_2-20120614/13468_1 /TAXON_ID=2856 /ORGANISM="Cylindrotheca closterium" /LENGTH=58 /DNA_ID=CAMNT_0000536209 /DNA_START=124 /DNA_END=296 /DNA_ORIENTATION=+ /assembly_acc=CAM_ASM_000147
MSSLDLLGVIKYPLLASGTPPTFGFTTFLGVTNGEVNIRIAPLMEDSSFEQLVAAEEG